MFLGACNYRLQAHDGPLCHNSVGEGGRTLRNTSQENSSFSKQPEGFRTASMAAPKWRARNAGLRLHCVGVKLPARGAYFRRPRRRGLTGGVLPQTRRRRRLSCELRAILEDEPRGPNELRSFQRRPLVWVIPERPRGRRVGRSRGQDVTRQVDVTRTWTFR